MSEDRTCSQLLPLTNAPRGPDFLAGTSVSDELLELMTLRYGDSSGRVSLPSLVCLLLRLEAMASKCHLGDILETFSVTKKRRRGSGMPSCPRPRWPQ